MPSNHITSIERGEISAYLAAGYSKGRIARQLGRHPSSIGREIARNALKGVYDPLRAQALYHERRKECRPARRLDYQPLWSHVFRSITSKVTPEYISLLLPGEFPNDPRMRISHEAIYQGIYADERMHCLIKYLVQARPKRRKRGQGKTRRGPSIPNRVGIEERPQEVNARSRFGDWEGDLIVGAAQSGYFLTLVERKSLLTRILKLETKEAETVAAAIIEVFMDLQNPGPKPLHLTTGQSSPATKK